MKKKNISLFGVTIGLIILGVFGLIFTNMRDVIFGTPFEISMAADGTTVSSSFLPISGSAKHARDILVNGRSVAVDREGNFLDAVILSPGYNTVQVALKDQFGKTRTKTYQLVYTPESSVAQNPLTDLPQ